MNNQILTSVYRVVLQFKQQTMIKAITVNKINIISLQNRWDFFSYPIFFLENQYTISRQSRMQSTENDKKKTQ